MHRNFGLRQSANDYWNGRSGEDGKGPRWPYVVIGAAVLIIIAVALLAS